MQKLNYKRKSIQGSSASLCACTGSSDLGSSWYERISAITTNSPARYNVLVFHGAEHSRFSHSLGVYEIVRRIVDDIFVGRPEWDEDERLLVLCAALLHDLGHGPFSHAFENVFELDHEFYTRQILLGDTEVNAVLKSIS